MNILKILLINLKKIKFIFKKKEHKVLIENFSSLSLLQIVNYVLPLIVLPYLIRVLGTEKFGLIIFAKVFIQYFILISDYGFNLSAVREIAICKNNNEKIEEIVSCVYIIKFLLIIVSFILLSIIVFSYAKFAKNWLIYLLTFPIVLGQAFFPVWFFQGIEKMKYITLLNILPKLLFTLLIFLLINKEDDYIYVPVINSLGFIVSGLAGYFLLIYKFKVKIKLVHRKKIIVYFKEGLGFFLSRLSSFGYSSINTLLIGIFFSNTLVTFYYTADKIIAVILTFLQPVIQSIYPYFSKDFKPNQFKRFIYLFFILSCMAGVLILFSSNFLSNFLYDKKVDIFIKTLNYLVLLLPISTLYVFLGAPFLLSLGYKKDFNNSILLGFALHILLLSSYFLFFNVTANLIHFVFILILSKLFVLYLRIYYSHKRKILKYLV